MSSKNTKRLPVDSGKLVNMVLAMLHSGSRIEDRFWEQRIDTLLAKSLQSGNKRTLDAALSHAEENYPEVYDMLADLIEIHSGSFTFTDAADSKQWDVVLIAAPILAWTRYTLPSGPLPKKAVKSLQEKLESCIGASGGVRIGLSPYLYSIDQLPNHYVEAWDFGQKMAKAMLSKAVMPISEQTSQQTAPILADPRFLMAVVMAPAGKALFRWQEDKKIGQEARADCLTRWIEQTHDTLRVLLPGCEWECLLPDALYCASREADEHIRPHTLNTAVRYLCEALDEQPNAFYAVIAGFGDKQLTEYRISFTQRGSDEVIYGVVWPLYEREEEVFKEAYGRISNIDRLNPLDEIIALLKKNGITEIRRHLGPFDLQYCDDCESPLYADPHGEIVHAEMPEEANTERPQLH